MMKNTRLLVSMLLLVMSVDRATNGASVTIAHDTAANSPYDDGWDKGDNGGFGFGPWQLYFDGDNSLLDPVYGGSSHFIDGMGVGPMPANGLGPRAFGMTTTRRKDMASAQRSFLEPLNAGRSLQIELDGSDYEVGQFFGIGNKLQLLGDDGVPRYELSSTDNHLGRFWTVNGSPTNVPYAEPATLSFSPVSGDRYSATLASTTALVAHFTLNAALPGTPGMPITGMRFENTGTGSSIDGATEMFFGQLKVVEFVPEQATMTLSVLSALALIGYSRRPVRVAGVGRNK